MSLWGQIRSQNMWIIEITEGKKRIDGGEVN